MERLKMSNIGHIRTTVSNLRQIFPIEKSSGPDYEDTPIYYFRGETQDGHQYSVYDSNFDFYFTETHFLDFTIDSKYHEQAKKEMLQAMKDKGLPEEKPRREICKMNTNELVQKVLKLQNGEAFLRKAILRGIEDKMLDKELIEN